MEMYVYYVNWRGKSGGKEISKNGSITVGHKVRNAEDIKYLSEEIRQMYKFLNVIDVEVLNYILLKKIKGLEL